MEDFVNAMTIIFDGLKTDFSLYGFSFSLWDVFMHNFVSIIFLFLCIFLNLKGRKNPLFSLNFVQKESIFVNF